MSKIDTFDIVPIFGEIGFLKGYLGGLAFRVANSDIPVDYDDIVRIENAVRKIDEQLTRLMEGKHER